MSRKLRPAAALVALLTASPASAQQIKVDLNPYFGFYLPTADVYEWSETEAGTTTEITGKHGTGFQFGGRVILWFTSLFGLEGGFAYASSEVDYELSFREPGFTGSVSTDASASVWRASIKGLFDLTASPDTPADFFVGGGLVLVGRGGDAYDRFSWVEEGSELVVEAEGTTNIGFVLNVGTAFNVSEAVAIRFDLEDYIHSVEYDLHLVEIDGIELDEDLPGDGKMQNDLSFSGGVVIRLGR